MTFKISREKSKPFINFETIIEDLVQVSSDFCGRMLVTILLVTINMTENFSDSSFDVTNFNFTFQYQTAFAEKNLNDLKYEMLEKQVGLLNGELKALKTVNDMLKEGFSNWC